jgi:hypothetical protein
MLLLSEEQTHDIFLMIQFVFGRPLLMPQEEKNLMSPLDGSRQHHYHCEEISYEESELTRRESDIQFLFDRIHLGGGKTVPAHSTCGLHL